MNILIILAAVIMVGAIIFLTMVSSQRTTRKGYLKNLMAFVEGEMTSIEGAENSFRIQFIYKEKEFIYEDIEEQGFNNALFHSSYLKVRTKSDLNLAFTEKERHRIRDNVSSLKDIHSPWKQNVGKVMLPEELEPFSVYTNNPMLINELMRDEQIIRIFVRFKNVDSRGHPLMSLEIMDGTIILKFHSTAGLRPNLFDLQQNVTLIEDFLEKLVSIVDKVNEIKADQDFSK